MRMRGCNARICKVVLPCYLRGKTFALQLLRASRRFGCRRSVRRIFIESLHPAPPSERIFLQDREFLPEEVDMHPAKVPSAAFLYRLVSILIAGLALAGVGVV